MCLGFIFHYFFCIQRLNSLMYSFKNSITLNKRIRSRMSKKVAQALSGVIKRSAVRGLDSTKLHWFQSLERKARRGSIRAFRNARKTKFSLFVLLTLVARWPVAFGGAPCTVSVSARAAAVLDRIGRYSAVLVCSREVARRGIREEAPPSGIRSQQLEQMEDGLFATREAAWWENSRAIGHSWLPVARARPAENAGHDRAPIGDTAEPRARE